MPGVLFEDGWDLSL